MTQTPLSDPNPPDPNSDAAALPLPNALGWGLFWGTICAAGLGVLSNSIVLLELESAAQRRVWRSRTWQNVADEIVIVGIDGQLDAPEADDVTLPDFSPERLNYAALTQRLLEDAGARTVVLNLPGTFAVPQALGDEDLDAPLRRAMEAYADRVVVATRTSESFGREEIPIYNHFLPIDIVSLRYIVPPESVQGFVQFSTDRTGVLRELRFAEQLVRRDSQRLQGFFSVERLALSKAELATELPTEPFYYKPLTPGALPIIPIEQVCAPQLVHSCLGSVSEDALQPLRDKIVLVGFVEGSPESHPVRLPDGGQVSAVELQGLALSSLLQGEVFQVVPFSWRAGVMLLAGLGTGVVLTMGLNLRRNGTLLLISLWGRVAIVVLLAAVYSGASIVSLLTGHWLWPIAMPAVVAGATTLATLVSLLLIHSRDRLQAKQRELERMQQEEQEAITRQARKLLYRVATDIHDSELQELKLVMDEIELLQLDNPALEVDGILTHLQDIGIGIRRELNDARSLASKFGISPDLKGGLHAGIANHIQQLVADEKLDLLLQVELPPLREPQTSEWFDAREDIYRFAREAIANVIQHVHPPRGSGTYLQVVLDQTGADCLLQVENDGVELVPAKKGGYGTKAMNTIAQQLPEGKWNRVQTEDRQTIVTLTWSMKGLWDGE
ncbi:MAG: CHASE2 domain-containing protein [Cyanobacteria bacterium P01_A01_bin.3]